MTAVLLFFLVLAALILSHEGGHFCAAKWARIRVDEFGFGFPPRLFAWKKGETTYSINLLPFGGFVRIFGEEEAEGDPRSFSSQPRIVQAAVVGAGIAANFLLAWAILGASDTIAFTREILQALTHINLSMLTGPVGLVGIVGQASAQGIGSLLDLTALISINLAVINLLPLPGLDGGRLLVILIEAIRRKPVNPEFLRAATTLGLAALILLMCIVTVRDIAHLAVVG